VGLNSVAFNPADLSVLAVLFVHIVEVLVASIRLQFVLRTLSLSQRLSYISSSPISKLFFIFLGFRRLLLGKVNAPHVFVAFAVDRQFFRLFGLVSRRQQVVDRLHVFELRELHPRALTFFST